MGSSITLFTDNLYKGGRPHFANAFVNKLYQPRDGGNTPLDTRMGDRKANAPVRRCYTSDFEILSVPIYHRVRRVVI